MVTVLVSHGGGQTQLLESVPTQAGEWLREGSTIWIDLSAPSEEEVKAVGEVFRFDPEALDDCLSGEQRPRIDEYDDYIFLLLYGMLGAEAGSQIDPRKLAAFVGERLLVTVHLQPLRTLATLRERAQRHPGHFLSRGVPFFLYTIIDKMVDNYLSVTGAYEKRLDKLEAASLDPDVTADILTDLMDLRRDLLELRGTAAAEQEMLMPLTRGEFEYVSAEVTDLFRHVYDHLKTVVEQLDAQRDLLNGVRDNYHAAVAHRTNAAMHRLTTFATVLLPMTLVAGIYGMNVPLWPPVDHPLSFVAILGLMIVMGIGSLLWFRRRRWG